MNQKEVGEHEQHIDELDTIWEVITQREDAGTEACRQIKNLKKEVDDLRARFEGQEINTSGLDRGQQQKPQTVRMKSAVHTDRLGRLAEDMALVKLSALFDECIVSQVVNNQLHDLEIRSKEEQSTNGICRIQVKSTNSKGNINGHQFYALAIHHGSDAVKKQEYERDDVDFFIFYVFPEGKFYIVPSEAVKGKFGTKLYVGLPKPKQGKAVYEKYLEAWDLIADFLRGRQPAG